MRRSTRRVREGGLRDAVLFSVGANGAHGLQRTREDKRNAVLVLLNDEEWSRRSDREIAKRCSVSPTFVGTVRGSLSTVDSEPDARTYVTRHGTVAQIDTSRIGARLAEPLPPIGDITARPAPGSNVLHLGDWHM